MNLANVDLHAQQIAAAFEDCNLSPEEIAEQFELDILVVKSSLQSTSAKYRKAMAIAEESDERVVTENNLKLSPDELSELHHNLKHLATNAESEHTQSTVGRWLIDEHYGRHDRELKQNQQPGTQINLLNMTVREANKQIAEMDKSQTIDIGSCTSEKAVTDEE